MPDIIHQVTIKGTDAQIYYALTRQEGLAGWWTRHTQAATVVGATSAFSFNKGETVFTMRIEALDEPTRVRWYCLSGHPEWAGTIIEFKLKTVDAGTTEVNFKHLGWRSTDGILGMCSYDWAGYLWSLKELIEGGVGHPYEDPPLPE
ncbi:MAG: SRPBCC domain-containing protein [Acidimicrobiia bacterium]|nr:SRPBCC domain-containing protein [Acidimicrobiia bacterium]